MGRALSNNLINLGIKNEVKKVLDDMNINYNLVEDEEPGKKGLPARAVLNADGTVTLQLVKPVVLTISKGGQERSETFAELTFRELTGADLRVVAQEKDDMRRTIMTLARATGTSSVVMNVLFDRMAQRDVAGATEVISYFQE